MLGLPVPYLAWYLSQTHKPQLGQSIYENFNLNLPLIATEGFSTVFDSELYALKHIKSPKKSREGKRVKTRVFYDYFHGYFSTTWKRGYNQNTRLCLLKSNLNQTFQVQNNLITFNYHLLKFGTHFQTFWITFSDKIEFTIKYRKALFMLMMFNKHNYSFFALSYSLKFTYVWLYLEVYFSK